MVVIKRLPRRTFRFINDVKQTFKDTALTLAWNIVVCRGEAVVHIGSIAMNDEEIVVSGNQIALYNKSAILQALNINAAQWLSVGIVSGKDYDSNIKGFGNAANYDIIIKLKEETIAEVDKQYLCAEGVSKVRDNGPTLGRS